ncbi:uncharacterized protein LOC112681366 [Sipha flava]|uniref:Acetylserotonin O-methyltransferase n=1 Tax=Sipha flava TaxID=143950 RepID=A0A8B8FAI6_9HEMI|nr:uncharacterized protein LOC112681366 [Sipha flava]
METTDKLDNISLCEPRVDDCQLWDVFLGIYGYSALLIAHRMKLFAILAKKPHTLEEICSILDIKSRPAEALLVAAVNLGFLRIKDGKYLLMPVAEEYLLENSPNYFGYYWDIIIDNHEVYSFASLEKAICTDTAQAYGGGDVFKSHEENNESALKFTRAMHSVSMGSAQAWPKFINLSKYRLLLDVGGGSGAHSIGAVSKWSKLQATIFDLAPVCTIAQEFIDKYALHERINTYAGDMWNDAFPSADLHFYSNIYHDWTPEKCLFLTEKSFKSLEQGGRIIVHELLYNDKKNGPFSAVGCSMLMLGWAEGKQYSGKELSKMMQKVGFKDIQVIPTFGYFSIVTGVK